MVDSTRTFECKTIQLNRQSRSCCAEGSFKVGDSGDDSRGDIHVRRIVIHYIVGETTHLSYCVTVWDALQGKT